MKGSLYLIPNKLGESSSDTVIPAGVSGIIKKLRFFIVENIRSARRYIISCGYDKSIDEIIFYELGKHTNPADIPGFLKPCLEGEDVGVISEAGAPAVADPGAAVTSLAHKQGIRVIPLTGPSSILLALMASGLNGQNFCFHGYLPLNNPERSGKISEMEKWSQKTKQTQIFMEVPFRNNKLLAEILKVCNPSTNLCIACDLTTETEFIKTQKISEWRKEKIELHKRPCIFLIG